MLKVFDIRVATVLDLYNGTFIYIALVLVTDLTVLDSNMYDCSRLGNICKLLYLI